MGGAAMETEATDPVRDASGAEAALSVDGVSHRFGAKMALEDVSLTVATGSFTTLLGVNGAGKTTLFNLITRLYGARVGEIQVCGHDLRRYPRQALAHMGTVFQSPSLDRALTVRQNLYYHGALHGLGPAATLAAGRAMLDRLGIADLLDRRVATLSGGQARRVEIARALLHRPTLLLCDEATVGLDVKARQDIVAYLHAETAAGRLGVLWATHLTEEVALDDPVVILHQGQVKARGYARMLAPDGDLAAAFLTLTAAP